MLSIEELKIGMTASYSQTITDADIKSFAALSGDRNPVHMDEVYASSSRYKRRIVHGMLITSFYSALFGTKLPGEGCVYKSQNTKFRKPIYVGDTIVVTVEIKSINIEKRTILFDTYCKVGRSKVITGEAEIYMPFHCE